MLEINEVRCGYDNKEIVKGVSFNVKRGNNLCIVGPNGCGKSTLLKSIANLLDYKGNIKIDSKEVNKLNRKDLAKNVALMSQASNIYFPYTVYETVALGRYAHLKGVFSKINKKDNEIILKSIANKIVVAVLHDLNLVQTFGEKVVMMNEGKVITSGTPKEVLNGEKLKEVYGVDVKGFMVEALKKWK